jgi:hypothetical protein
MITTSSAPRLFLFMIDDPGIDGPLDELARQNVELLAP